MTPDQFKRVESVFERAIELPPGERTAFVRAEAADDALVRRKVEGMLASDAGGSSLETPALGVGFHVGSPEMIERSQLEEFARGANFRVLSKIGEGGFGTVYRAEQLHPVRRLVALKVIKLGMDTQQVVARFEAERQALAMMDHPAIARVYEAGATPSGRPYFAMELVDGVPITQYCDTANRSVRRRLELFLGVCRAVQHAHQRGIIHRDLKPSNVLVMENDGEALPKIIDFGIARAVAGSGPAENASMTMQGQPLGTPAHMSPEQAAGERDIDTRTDVYSLGVLLYELLTGGSTLSNTSLETLPPAAVVKMVREWQPQRPSQRAAALAGTPEGVATARRRSVEPKALARRLRGDLDWIVMTALEKDRSRRYATADAFAVDIARHLANQPISAHPPASMYRIGKFARRNRVALTVIGLVFLAFLGTSAGLVRSRAAEIRARTDAQIAQEVNAFLNDDLLASVAPEEMGSDVKMRDVLNRASERIEGRFADQPAVEAAVRLTLGRTFSRLAEFEQAERHLTRAYELRVQLFGRDDPRTLEVVHELGQWRWFTERYDLSEQLFREAFEGRLRRLGPDHPDTLASQYGLAAILGEQGRYEQTRPILLDALQRSRRAGERTHKLTAELMRTTGLLYLATNETERALAMFEECYSFSRRSLGAQHPTTLLAMRALAELLLERGEHDRSRDLLVEALEISRKVRGEGHPATLLMMATLGKLYIKMGDNDAAEKAFQRAIDTGRASLPPGHTVVTRIELMLAGLHDLQGRHQLAEPVLVEAVAYLRRQFGEQDPLTQQAVTQLAEHYTKLGRAEDAEAVKQGRK